MVCLNSTHASLTLLLFCALADWMHACLVCGRAKQEEAFSMSRMSACKCMGAFSLDLPFDQSPVRHFLWTHCCHNHTAQNPLEWIQLSLVKELLSPINRSDNISNRIYLYFLCDFGAFLTLFSTVAQQSVQFKIISANVKT